MPRRQTFIVFLFAGIRMENSTVSLTRTPLAVLWATAYGLVSVLIIFTNIISIIAFVKTKPRRKHTHYFLINLSIADFMVGALSVPLFISYMIDPGVWSQGVVLPMVYSSMDILSGLASVFTLSIVSVERLIAVSIPFKFRMIRRKTYFLCILATWFLSACVASMSIAFYLRIVKESFYTVVILSLSLALVVACFAYISIVFKINRKNSAKGSKDMKLEQRLSITLLCVTAIFVFSWLPFELVFILVHFCKTCSLSLNAVFFIKLLHYSNSFMNTVVYTFRIPEFKEAIVELFSRSSNQFEGDVLLHELALDATTCTSVTRLHHQAFITMNDPAGSSPSSSPVLNGCGPQMV